tara:strand:+ start:45143 stop:45586 length:444 start_codon:yes stop_codon:yes gene_type:complete
MSYRFISNVALLASPLSIQILQIKNQSIYLEDKSGRRFVAKPLKNTLIHPTFSLLSFDCEPINDLSFQTKSAQNKNSPYQSSSTEIIHIASLDKTTNTKTRTILEKIQHFLPKRILSENRRHLIICRYNAVDSSAFRRIRVWLKFNQ